MRTNYCLACFEDLEARDEPVQACAACGAHNRRSDRRLYWNLNPGLRRLELVGKVAVVLAGVVVGFLIMLFSEGHMGSGGGYAMAFPLAAGVVLWETIGGLTRHNYLFRPAVLWPTIFLVAIPFVLLFTVEAWGVTTCVSLAITCAVAAPSSLFLARACRRWKQQLIEGGNPSVPAPRRAA